MNELRNSKSDDQLEELLLQTEQMQEELDQKDRTIRELKVQLDESLTLNEKLNSEKKTENIQSSHCRNYILADKNTGLWWMSGGCGNTFGIHRNKDCRAI